MNQIPNPRWSGPRIKHESTAGDAYAAITVEKLTPIIGAEIGGVDIGRPVRTTDGRDPSRARREPGDLLPRPDLTLEQHLKFGRSFGELHIHPAAPTERGHPELMIIKADKDSPRANGEGWHTDVSCDAEPPMGSILYIKECPPDGGDTLFANMYAAYEALSDRMKAYLEGLTAVHDGEENYRGTYANFGVKDRPVYPRAEHPVVRTHPVTGKKALFVNKGFTRRILGHPARRKRRHPGLSLRAHGQPAVPVPLPLAGEFRRVLGQSLRPASRDVGLLAAHAVRQPGDGQGRPARLMRQGGAGLADRRLVKPGSHGDDDRPRRGACRADGGGPTASGTCDRCRRRPGPLSHAMAGKRPRRREPARLHPMAAATHRTRSRRPLPPGGGRRRCIAYLPIAAPNPRTNATCAAVSIASAS